MGFLDIFKRKPSYEKLKEKALALETKKDYLGAARVWKRIAKSTPDPFTTYITVAENLSKSGNKEQAVEWFYKAVSITPEDSPDCSEIERKYGEALMDCGRYGEAELQFIIAQDVDPNNWNVHFSYGKLHEKIGEKDLAIGHYIEVYQNASPDTLIWNLSHKKIKQLGGKVPEMPRRQKAYQTDVDSKGQEPKSSSQNQDSVEATTNSILSLPNKAFFLYVARLLQRTVGQNALKSLHGYGPTEAVTQIIESLYQEFERYAGISTGVESDGKMVDFDDKIDKSNSFELNIATQWYNVRSAIVKIQTVDAKDNNQVKEAKLQILKACEMMLVASAGTFGWDYVPQALQSAWDLDTLTLLKERNKLDKILQLGFDPFVNVNSEKKGLDRLKNFPTIDLTSTVQNEVSSIESNGVSTDSSQDKAKPGEGVVINVPAPSGNAYVDGCFDIGFQDVPDARNWFEIRKIKEAQPLQWAGDIDQALEQMRRLISEYNDFDIVYSWTSEVYRRKGNPTGAIDILMEGLRNAKLKAGLCCDIGTIYFEDLKNLKKAITWWIRSSAIQMGGGTADLAFSFLNLSAVANPFPSLDTERQWLLDQADRIDSNRTRFNEKGLNERHQMAINQGDDSMIIAIKQFYRFYSGEMGSAGS